MPSLFKEIFQLAFRRFVKDRGRFPTPAERDALQDVALKESRKQMENIDPVFKGVDKMDPEKPFRGFKPKVVPKDRPEPFNKLIDPKSDTGIKLGKVREGLKKRETEAEMLARMKRQNKESVERLKKKKEKDREDFSGGGGAGLPAATGGDMVYSSGARIPGAPNIPMGEFETGIGPILLGIYGQGGFSDNPVAPDIPVDVATTEQQYGIATQIPIGDTGFTIGANYDKSRVNQRFTGDLIPNQVFKSVPVDEDRFNVGINFTKSFQEGGPVDPDRRTFVKILGGLASIPILGKFVAPLKQAAPVVAETAKEVPAYFFKLVDKIRRLGDDAPGLTSIERESGKRYKNYEMVEDQTTGDIIIKKQKQGSTMVGDDMVEGTMSEEVLAYRTPKNTPEGRLSADYEEITVRPDFEGKMRDVEDGLDSMSEILEEVGEAQLKKAGGGLAYMLGE